MILDKIARSPRLNSAGFYSGTQTVFEHCYNVAKTAKDMGRDEVEAEKLFYLGLFHDVGKYHDKFQNKIRGIDTKSFSHPSYSVPIFYNSCSIYDDILAGMVINGHHIGLENAKDFMVDIIPYLKAQTGKIESCFYKDVHSADMTLKKIQIFPSTEYRKKYTDRQLRNLEMSVRYYFSTLVDADHTDAERASDFRKHLLRGGIEFDTKELLNNYWQYNNEFGKKNLFGISYKSKSYNNNINRWRRDIRDTVIAKAKNDIDFGVLDVLTGLGKTNTMIGYGLEYMKHHRDKKRIIFVVPFISVIDQFEETLNNILGRNDIVLSHHSNDSIKISDKFYHEKMSAVENYFGYPIIITTYVQFFDTIFSNRSGKVKKLHNMADSIIMFDEFHTIPLDMTQVYLEALQNMNAIMNCSFVFSSATFPNLIKTQYYENGIPSNKLTYLYEKSEDVFNDIDRVDYEILGEIKDGILSNTPLEILRSDIDTNLSTLIIVNTKSNAYALFTALRDLPFDSIYFLSGWKTKHDNQETIHKIKGSLKNKDKILVVSTQIIEAGVDVDFPVVYRHIAPMEAILQTAGRCNREFSKKKGVIKIFSMDGSSMPHGSSYSIGTKTTIRFLERNPNILTEYNAFKKYYFFFSKNGFHRDKLQINDMRKEFRYKDVAENAYVIDTESIGVIIPNDITNSVLKNKKFLNRNDRRMLAPYEIALFPREVYLMQSNGIIKEHESGALVYNSVYEASTGISPVMCPEIYNKNETFII